MKTLKLKFENSISSLCGFDFGHDTFEKQVKGELVDNEAIEVEIPSTIDTVSMSFAQGFFSEIADKHQMKNVEKFVMVKSNHDRVLRKFKDAILIRSNG